MAHFYARRPKRAKWIILPLFFLALSLAIWGEFDAYRCRSMQSEAKYNLNLISQAQHFYFEENGSFTSLKILLDRKLILLKGQYYEFSDISYSDDRYLIEAKASEYGPPGDTWILDQTGILQNSLNACNDL